MASMKDLPEQAPLVLICLLDKADPPAESFIDGMLAAELPAVGCRVWMLCARGEAGLRPRRYGHAVCLPWLRPRRGVGRFINLPLAWWRVRRLQARARRRGLKVALLARNDPIQLLAAALVRRAPARLVFQQTFPHEHASHPWSKRTLARWLMRLASRRVDALMAVSPLGLERLRGYFPAGLPGIVVPLLVPAAERAAHVWPADTGPMRFVYMGTHDPDRRLDLVLEAIVEAVSRGAHVHFDFIGGRPDELAPLRCVTGVTALEQAGRLRFISPVPRSDMPALLARYQVGLSLIPPLPIYREASPTKLAECMGAGLAVLASRGIPLQERMVEDSGGGYLVDWEVSAMADAIVALSANQVWVRRMRERGWTYAREVLTYALLRRDIFSALWSDTEDKRFSTGHERPKDGRPLPWG
ncbi:glycosyltransferase [Ectothiorhodospira haloalkaliphila]|uniref:glycosyltransferase n=1 Tax=Ectothiorhodospira haloalkaliphila TaxID=421628 RepID=UPI001EE81D71|nr:glycosyltransferase [Ectothiorhodospira haloalkaliphila]MCG5526256.1 glycosyltransferase [Ectothiorhodospira haloalkaliphila]